MVKKVFYLVVMSVLLFGFSVLPAHAAVVFTEDFEAGYGLWSADNGVWEVGTPTAGPPSCYSGSQCAGTVLGGDYPVTTDSRLISPSIILPSVTGGEEIHLRFWQWFSYAASDIGYVQISVYDNVTGTWSNWSTIGNSTYEISPVWSLMDIDLTSYASKKIRIAFYHTADPYPFSEVSTGWYIDDMQIIKKLPQVTGDFETGWDDWGADRGVWEVGTPTAGPPSCYSGSQCAGTVLGGDYPVSTDSRLISPSIILPSVTGGEEIHLRFWQWFSYAASDIGYVQISVYDNVTGTWSNWSTIGNSISEISPVWSLMDIDLTSYASKKIRIAFYHTADPYPFSEVSTGWYIDDMQIIKKLPQVTGDFETGWDDWGADRGVWEVGTPTAGPPSCYSGSQCVGTVLGGNYPVSTDSRLISPSIVLSSVTGGEEIHLRFWQWFSYAASDAGYVQISVYNNVAGTWSNWSNISGPIVNTSSSWTLMDIDLTSYASNKIRIAFYHTADPYPFSEVSTGWYIDDMQIIGPNPVIYYCDKDNDTYINSLSDGTCTGIGCQPTGCQIVAGTDCNDSDLKEHPGQTWYKDTDNDGYSNGNTLVQCSRPLGYKIASELIATSGDCNDNDLAVNPGKTEGPSGDPTCSDGKDNDCDGKVDANDSTCTTTVDLIVLSLTTSSSSSPGQPVTVTYTIKNQGTASAGASSVKFYWSTDTTLSGGDTYLGSGSVPSLPAVGTNTGSISVTIPSVCAYNFYIIAVADGDNSVAETNESNNTKNKSISIGPDLTVSSLTVPTTGGAGLPITISDTTKNNGGDTAIASNTKFYLSTNSTFEVWDKELSGRLVPSLAPLATSTGSTSVTIPSDTPAGTFYIIAVSDATGVVAEFNEANNNLNKSIKIGPDLIVSTITAPTSAVRGSAISVTDTTKNNAGGGAGVSTTKLYLSTNTVYNVGDTYLGQRAVPALLGGAVSTGSTPVTIPAGITAGAYYIIAVSDADNVVIETAETNNSKYKAITIQ